MVQSLRELPRMGRVEDGQPVHDLRMGHRGGPGHAPAPVMTGQQRGLGAAFVDETAMSAVSWPKSYALTPSGFDDRL